MHENLLALLHHYVDMMCVYMYIYVYIYIHYNYTRIKHGGRIGHLYIYRRHYRHRVRRECVRACLLASFLAARARSRSFVRMLHILMLHVCARMLLYLDGRILSIIGCSIAAQRTGA